MTFGSPEFWIALMQIIGVNIVLSGDNAVVIALAARSLPPKQQKQAVLWGSGAAVVMRIVLTIVAVQLLTFPYLKLVGAALLLWIGVQLLLPEEETADGEGKAGANTGMVAAIRTILIADLVMSLDNVIAVAAAAQGSIPLLVIGLAISVPLIVAGAALIMALLTRLPALVWAGAGLLGWIAGEVMATDPIVQPTLHAFFDGPVGVKLDAMLGTLGKSPIFANGGHGGEVLFGIVGIVIVLVWGYVWRARKLRSAMHPTTAA